MKVKVLDVQLCPTLCDSIDYSLSGSSVRGIVQARILEWVAIPFSRGFPNPGIKPGSPALQTDSLPYIHRHTHTYIFFFRFFSIMKVKVTQ